MYAATDSACALVNIAHSMHDANMTRQTHRCKAPDRAAERGPIVHLYNFTPHDVRCLGNSFSDGGEDFSLSRRALAGA